MEFVPFVSSKVGSTAMDNLRDTIEENNALNKEADRVRITVRNFFNSQEHRLQANLA